MYLSICWYLRVLPVLHRPEVVDIGRIHLPVCTCTVHGKCSKISNTFLFLFFNKMLVVRAGIHKILDRIVNREDPDQTCVWVGCSIFDRQVVFNISDHR